MVTIGGNGRSHEIEGVFGASAGGDGGTVRASDSQGGGMVGRGCWVNFFRPVGLWGYDGHRRRRSQGRDLCSLRRWAPFSAVPV